MPVADHLRPEDLQHGYLVRPVFNGLVRAHVLVAAKGSLAAMLQQLDFVEQHVVALIVSLRRLLLL